MSGSDTPECRDGIAITGMSCRFPGARNVDEYWRNLRNGVESVTFFSDEELLSAGIDRAVVQDPDYVKARALLTDVDLFDASFFGFTSREAEITDPQHRIFLECAWEALEHAGCDPATFKGLIGVYAGSGACTYLINNLITRRDVRDAVGNFQLLLGNEKDYLASRVSYKLNLKGPSVVVQTACSTSLVAVHLACESLLTGECDLALAGGASITLPQQIGYRYQEAGILSPDGHCRTFDAKAQGTIFGSGAGVVVLKRLSDALADGDEIHAVIRGSAINNDGSLKVTYTAPGVQGQAEVIASALSIAGVEPEEISYVEAHGTATPLGDPIEIEAITKVFRASTERKNYCAIGSVKSNFGHLDTVAGLAGLIKTVLMLKHQELAPSLHFNEPNPKIDFGNSPFYVNSTLQPWNTAEQPRCAGVSSFGIGGTNAHLVVEEAPAVASDHSARPYQLLLLSAKTNSALDTMTANLVEHLRAHPETSLADAAYTLQVGRATFNHRRMVTCTDVADAIDALEAQDERVVTAHQEQRERAVAFMFPGQGAQYVNMARDLYQTETVFREQVDQCTELLKPHLKIDLRDVLYPTEERTEAATQQLNQTAFTQPALFVIEYALARLWMSWGVQPAAMIGHSVGEYVAACLAGVLSLQDALRLVAARGRLIQSLRRGAMLAVPLPPDKVQSLARGRVSLAAINGPSRCVLSGPTETIETVRNELTQLGVTSQLLHTSHAFHSEEMDLILEPFVESVKEVELKTPSIPYLSNVTGTWITAEEATSPVYWGKHLRQTVRFAEGVEELLQDAYRILLEVGPGRTLTTFADEQRDKNSSHVVLPSLRHPNDQRSDVSLILNTVGRLWLAGMPLDWSAFYAEQQRRRLTLPTYPFERQRYWVDPAPKTDSAEVRPNVPAKRSVQNWFYVPSWKRSTTPVSRNGHRKVKQQSTWMVFVDECGIGNEIVRQLEQRGIDAIIVTAGDQFSRIRAGVYTVNPQNRADYDSLFNELRAINRVPGMIVHLWSVTAPETPVIESFDTFQQRGLYSLLYLAQSLASNNVTIPIEIGVVSNQVQRVKDEDLVSHGKATVLGPCKVIPQEFPNIVCRNIDVDISSVSTDRLLTELMSQPSDVAVAYRGDERWIQTFDPVRLDGEANAATRLREGGVYLITGGLGNVGLILAESLAQSVRCKLILTARSAFPEKEEYDEWLASHDKQNDISLKIEKLRTLEQLGAEVMIVRADVSDDEQMREALSRVYTRFGAVHGVIHAAGNIKNRFFSSIEQTDPAQCDLHFQSKIHGLCVLERVLEDQELDFFVLVSSLSATLGGLGLVAYSAANIFMDAFAQQHSRPFVSINWDSFENHGAQDSAITRDEGMEAFQRVLAMSSSPHIIVSTTDLSARVDQWLKLKSVRDDADKKHGFESAVLQKPERLNTEVEQRVAAVWQRVLGAKEINSHDNFFDLGGNSLTALQVISELKKEFNVQITTVSLFEAPTVSRLAKVISPQQSLEQTQTRPAVQRSDRGQDIAIIGIAARYPGASNVDQFWQNLRDGAESITFFTEEELLSAGVSREVFTDERYIAAKPVLKDVELFDASFFHYSPREAEMLDPQHRLFLECAWEALETAGYDSENYSGSIGVFAGAGTNAYFLRSIGRDSVETVGAFQSILGVEKDSLTTTVSYKLNLRGPSITVQTFCSTSLVAAHLARQSLLSGECDMAMAGGVSVNLPQTEGYLRHEGVSHDGHCRAFDAKARGLILGSGVGVVVLKRLDQALADGDNVYAVIKGSALNNDGSLKVGYTAPSVDGQAEVITSALAAAGIEADTVSYIETHGAGTPLGDPIEFRALTKAFAAHTSNKNFCAIGSVKTNIGHADRAAGVAGLIKTALSLKHKLLPPSLNFEDPNPEIDFVNSPFYVNTKLSDWTANGSPRRAGVTSLGIGGTNAHVILEEAPAVEPSGPSRPWHLLVLSARSGSALETATSNLLSYFKHQPDADLADVAYTLQTSRRVFNHRRVLVCRDSNDAIAALDPPDAKRVLTSTHSTSDREVVFMFPGVGDHYVNMARELYETESIFREHIDHCAELLKPRLGLDLRDVLFPQDDAENAEPGSSGLDLRKMLRRNGNGNGNGTGTVTLDQTRIAQPAMFVVEYALAQLWMAWGIHPSAMIGYSIGECVAACLAGVFSLDDALVLVAERARLIQELPSGAMLAVPLPESEVQTFVDQKLSLSAVNGESFCVVSGFPEAVVALEGRLTERQLACRRLQTSHAFHSQMMTPIVEPFLELLHKIELKTPQIPFISTVTGTWIQDSEATDPGYWAQHLCQPVRFADGMRELWATRDQILLEVGPGQMLGSMALQLPGNGHAAETVVLASLRHSYERHSDVAFLLRTLGKLWMSGARVNWTSFYANERRHRVALPTYPFERQRCWIDRPVPLANTQVAIERKRELADWFYVPAWKQSVQPSSIQKQCNWLLFIDSLGLGLGIAKRLEQSGQHITLVSIGQSFDPIGDDTYTINPARPDDYHSLLKELGARGQTPNQIVHLWTITPAEQTENALSFDRDIQELGFNSLLFLAQALGEDDITEPVQIDVVSNNMHSVTGDEGLFPEKATVLGPCKVIPQEYQNVTCRSLDILLPEPGSRQETQLIEQLLNECQTSPKDQVVAFRKHNRWVQVFEPLQLTSADHPPVCLRERGVYLITGGLGGLGLAMAAYLANAVHARLVLVGRSSLPPREQWEQWLSTHDEQDRISTRIRKVQALEQSAAEVLVVAADVTDREDMQAVVAQTHERFGEINGVIHAAGVPGAGLTQLKTQESAARVIAPKVRGTLVLNEVLKDSNPDFMVLISSNISITGGLGQVDYCAANAFLDVFAQANASGSGTRVVAIDWGAWQWDDWHELLTAFGPEVQARMKQGRATYGITDDEGTEALARILRSGLPQIVVSTQDFRAIMDQHATFTTSGLMNQLETIKESKPLSSRPILGTEYVAPRNGVEQQLAEMWQKLLGIDEVGVYDNFFELGGHSLLAIQLISRLRQTFRVELTLQSLLETPTIADAALHIEEILISRIDQLTDEEAQQLLLSTDSTD